MLFFKKFLLKFMVLMCILMFGWVKLNLLIWGINYWLVKFGGIVIVIVFLLFFVRSFFVVFCKCLNIFFSLRKYV